MSPYYEDEHVTLYHGDCLGLVELWTGADVLVTDPPYGVAFQSAWRTGTEQFDLVAGDADTAIRDAVLVLWGGASGPRIRNVAGTAPRPDTAAAHLGEGQRPRPRRSGIPVGLRRRGDLRVR